MALNVGCSELAFRNEKFIQYNTSGKKYKLLGLLIWKFHMRILSRELNGLLGKLRMLKLEERGYNYHLGVGEGSSPSREKVFYVTI